MGMVICQGCGQAFAVPPGYGRNKIQCPGCGVICQVPEGARGSDARPTGPATTAIEAPARPGAWEDEASAWLKEAEAAEPAESEPVLLEVVEPAPAPAPSPVRPRPPAEPVPKPSEEPFTCRRCGGKVRRQRECPVCGEQDDSPLPLEPIEETSRPEPTWRAEGEEFLPPDPDTVPPVPVGLTPHSLELDEPQPLALAPSEEEEETTPYEPVDHDLPRCPRCRKDMPVGAVLCASCGFNLRTRKKATRTYEPIARTWDTNITLTIRLVCLGTAMGFHLLLTGLAAIGGNATPFLLAGVPLTAILCFVLGTFDRLDLTRDTRGRVTLTRRWRVCFVPIKPQVTEVHGFEGVVIGQWNDAGAIEWAILISLLCLGLIPALIWWYVAIYCNHYHVSLARDHGFSEVHVYRGRSEEQMHDVTKTLCQASGLRVLG
jgi:hypothetical protein